MYIYPMIDRWMQTYWLSAIGMLPRQAEQRMLHSASGNPVVSWSIWMLCMRGTSPLLVLIHSHWWGAEWWLNFLMILLTVHSENGLSESWKLKARLWLNGNKLSSLDIYSMPIRSAHRVTQQHPDTRERTSQPRDSYTSSHSIDHFIWCADVRWEPQSTPLYRYNSFFFFFSMYRCQADHIRCVTYKPTHFDFICIPRHRAIYENHPTMNNHHEGMPRTSSRIWNSPFHQGWLSPHSRICDVSLDWPPYRKELDLGLWTFLEDRICVIGLVTSWLPCMYSPYSAAPDSVAVAESPAWALILLQKALHILAAIGCIISGT